MENDLQFLFQKALYFLKFRPRTEKEVYDYLLKKIKSTHYSTDDVEKVIEKLKEMDLLNDKKFIEDYVSFRSKNNPKSKKVLILELRKKGVTENLINEYFSQNQVDEEELAFLLLKKRWPRWAGIDKKKRFKKAFDFLARRGFSFEIAKKTIEKLSQSCKIELDI
jgi:regulatory protein